MRPVKLCMDKYSCRALNLLKLTEVPSKFKWKKKSGTTFMNNLSDVFLKYTVLENSEIQNTV